MKKSIKEIKKQMHSLKQKELKKIRGGVDIVVMFSDGRPTK